MFETFFTIVAVFGMTQGTATPGQPSSKWTVHYADTSCSAHREFESDNSGTGFTITTTPTASSMTISFQEGQIKGAGSSARGNGTITIEPSGREIAIKYSGATAASGASDIDVFVDRALFDDLADARSIAVRAGNRRYNIELANASSVVKAIGTCERSLGDAWGLDPTALASIKTPAKPRRGGPAVWYEADAYPESDIKRGIGGLTIASLSIDATGKIMACAIVKTSGRETLDRATCAPLLGRVATFYPAENLTGEAVASVQILPVRWTTPNRDRRLLPIGPIDVVITSR